MLWDFYNEEQYINVLYKIVKYLYRSPNKTEINNIPLNKLDMSPSPVWIKMPGVHTMRDTKYVTSSAISLPHSK